MKSILITGSNGFIGSHLAKYFYEKDYQIYGISKQILNKVTLNLLKKQMRI